MTARRSPEIDRRPLLRTSDVAERLNLSAYTVAEMARRGDIPSVLVGKNRRYRQSDIDRYVSRLSA